MLLATLLVLALVAALGHHRRDPLQDRLPVGISHVRHQNFARLKIFQFIGLPLKWREGTASPIRAVAVFND